MSPGDRASDGFAAEDLPFAHFGDGVLTPIWPIVRDAPAGYRAKTRLIDPGAPRQDVWRTQAFVKGASRHDDVAVWPSGS